MNEKDWKPSLRSIADIYSANHAVIGDSSTNILPSWFDCDGWTKINYGNIGDLSGETVTIPHIEHRNIIVITSEQKRIIFYDHILVRGCGDVCKGEDDGSSSGEGLGAN